MKKKILITAGGTQELIDDVRVLTNISSGALGCKIACALLPFYNIHYVHGKTTLIPPVIKTNSMNLECYQVQTALDTYDAMRTIISNIKVDAVIHSMAISDFYFKKNKPIKLKSNEPEAFVEYMRQTIAVNPKIISWVKKWDPNVVLVGFKFEVGSTPEELITLARASIEKNGCDLVIANDKEEMKLLQQHVARFVYSDKMKNNFSCIDSTAFGKDEIASAIFSFVQKVL